MCFGFLFVCVFVCFFGFFVCLFVSTESLFYALKSDIAIPAVLCLSKFALTLRCLQCFYLNYRIVTSSSAENVISILMIVAINL